MTHPFYFSTYHYYFKILVTVGAAVEFSVQIEHKSLLRPSNGHWNGVEEP
jgi:hypothetical protein